MLNSRQRLIDKPTKVNQNSRDNPTNGGNETYLETFLSLFPLKYAIECQYGPDCRQYRGRCTANEDQGPHKTTKVFRAV